MNPFQEQADNMAAYEEMLSEPLTGSTQRGASVVYANSEFPAVIGPFVVEQVLVDGGFSPRLMAQAIVQKSVCPNIVFRSSDPITAKAIGGAVRCKIQEIHDTFTEWRLALWDVNQGA